MNDQHDAPSWPQPTTTAVDQPEPAPSKTMAICSLVLSAIPVPVLWLASVGMGIAVLSRSKDGRDHGKALVLVGFSLIAVWVVMTAAVVAVAVAYDSQAYPDRPEDGTGDVLVEDVQAGDCLASDLDDDLVTTVELVPCDSRHRLETYASFNLPDGPFPGQKDVDLLSDEGCTDRFESYVGLPFDDSELNFQYVTPNEEIWADDRSVQCFLDTDEMTTGSLEDARR